jgi:hypothetical protein
MRRPTALRQLPCSDRRGAAVITALIVLLVMSGLVLAYLTVALEAKRGEDHRVQELDVEAASQSAITLAVNQLWGRFEFERRGQRTTPFDFRAYLDGLQIPDSAGEADPDAGRVSLLDALDLPEVDGRRRLGNSEIESLDVRREDLVEGTRLTLRARVVHQGSSLVTETAPTANELTEVWAVERSRFQGMEYALLGNNLNCAFCHMEVDSAPRYFNTQPELYGSFDRTRVGMLDVFQVRHGTNNSRLAGSLYLARGGVYSDGQPIPDWGKLDLKGWDFDEHGLLRQSPAGALSVVPLEPADPAFPKPLENLYLHYGAAGGPLVDGFLPSTFPAVFPDDGGLDTETGLALGAGAGNRLVDPAEFIGSTGSAEGSVSGGQIFVVANGKKLASSKDLADALNTSNTSLLEDRVGGHVVLQGTTENPLLLNGELAVDGDVVLLGVVKGTGTIKARGNIYLPADLNYADTADKSGRRLFGLAEDGTKNALALAAGGNILVGNIFHPRWGSGTVSAAKSSSFSFVWDEIAAFNKLEWIKSQPRLPGLGQDPKNPSLFKHDNPLYRGPDYMPRYYTFGQQSPVPMLIGAGGWDPVLNLWTGPELAGSWGSWALVTADPKNSSDPLLYGADKKPIASLSTLLPSDGWLDETLARAMLTALGKAHDAKQPLTVDAALYTANSIFGIVSSYNPNTRQAQLIVNGAIVAADIGLLAGKGIRVNYDFRSAQLLDIVYDSELSLRRLVGVDGLH